MRLTAMGVHRNEEGAHANERLPLRVYFCPIAQIVETGFLGRRSNLTEANPALDNAGGRLLLDLLDIGAGVGETSLLPIYKSGGGNG
jgi:hypothetical protein